MQPTSYELSIISTMGSSFGSLKFKSLGMIQLSDFPEKYFHFGLECEYIFVIDRFKLSFSRLGVFIAILRSSRRVGFPTTRSTLCYIPEDLNPQ
jgi:hypothetical protein